MSELAKFCELNPQVRYLMYGGKGGIGKTTCSAATAVYLSKCGYKVLLFSVDPQASLSDMFEQDLFGKGEVEIISNLWVCEVDADSRIAEYQQKIRQKILDMYGFDSIPDEIESYIQAAASEPAMEESAIFDAVVDLVNQGSYDYYVYDLVPLGHALYYLSMAAVYDAWIDKITSLRSKMREYEQVAATIKLQKELEEDMILQELLDIKSRINIASGVLTDAKHTAFFFVITPEEMVIQDTLKAAELFRKYNVPIRGYIVNRVLPENLFEQQDSIIPEYLKQRMNLQKRLLKTIEDKFGGQILSQIPEFESEIKGLRIIEKLVDIMFLS